jgi:hypothetical protein
MSTVLASLRHGVMVSDSAMADGDRRYPCRKIYRIGGALLGFAGEESDFIRFMDWFKSGMLGKVNFGESKVLILSPRRLEMFDANYELPVRITSGRDAIGTGGKAVMCAFEAQGFENPRRAVSIVCRHDANSWGPVRVYRL